MGLLKAKANTNKLKPLLTLLLLVTAAMGGIFTYQHLQHDFETLEGRTYSWSTLKGQWVVVNYFAPWCAPCLREMPELAKFNASLPSNTKLFAVNYDLKTLSELKEMTVKYNITIPVIVSSQSTALPMEKPPYLPATFIIGPEGKVVDTIMGELTAAHLTQRLQALKRE